MLSQRHTTENIEAWITEALEAIGFTREKLVLGDSS
jgi:hypothetical protein